MTRRVVVHGADTPLGATFVRLLAERGDHVAAMAEAPARRPLLADLAARRPGQVTLHAEAGRPGDEVVAEAGEALGGAVDLLVLAGWRDHAGPELAWHDANVSLAKVHPEALSRHFLRDAVTPLLVARAARRLLRAGTQPVVFAVTSWLGSFADRRDGGHYGQAMTAAALQMAMRSLAFDMEPDGVTVTCGNPGLYRTALHAPEIQPLPEDVVGGFLALLATPDPARHGRVVDWRGNLKEW